MLEVKGECMNILSILASVEEVEAMREQLKEEQKKETNKQYEPVLPPTEGENI